MKSLALFFLVHTAVPMKAPATTQPSKKILTAKEQGLAFSSLVCEELSVAQVFKAATINPKMCFSDGCVDTSQGNPDWKKNNTEQYKYMINHVDCVKSYMKTKKLEVTACDSPLIKLGDQLAVSVTTDDVQCSDE